MLILRLVSFLLLPLILAGALWLAQDDMGQRSALAIARAAQSSAEAATKRAQDGETKAANLAQSTCSRQAATSLAAGRTIERIARAPAPANGRGMVTSADLAKVIGQ